MTDTTEVLEWSGRTAVDPEGNKLGKIEAIYLDSETDLPEWALIHTGMFGGKSSFMPLAGSKSEGKDKISAPYTKQQVTDAPQMEADGELSQKDEAELYRHYGVQYSEARSDSGLPAGRDTGKVGRDVSGPETDDAMTRSEEELRVGVAQRETGRVRLVKHVVTENVTTTVPVQREEVRIEREPITDANRGAATSGKQISDEEHEVTLHAEEVVVEKNVVPKERVRMDVDTVTEEREVNESVRKEQIETEGDGRGRR